MATADRRGTHTAAQKAYEQELRCAARARGAQPPEFSTGPF